MGGHEPEEQNARHGQGQKTVQTDTGPVALAVPRDRPGSVPPRGVPKRPRRREGFDAQGLSLSAGGCRPTRARAPGSALGHGGGADAAYDHHRGGPGGGAYLAGTAARRRLSAPVL